MNKITRLVVKFMEMRPVDKLPVYFLVLIILWLLLSSPFFIFGSLMLSPNKQYLRDPTYSEVIAFLSVDQTDKNTYNMATYNCQSFTKDVMENARDLGIRSYFVIVQPYGVIGTHAIVGFNTTDFGMRYFEPQTDDNIILENNYKLVDCIPD